MIFKPVVLRNKNAPLSTTSTSTATRRIQSKQFQNNPSAQQAGNLSKVRRKLDDSTSASKHTTVSKSFTTALMKACGGKKMTQLDLANATNQLLSVIKHYESGKAMPNGQIINKLNRVLGVSLPSTKAPKKNDK
jgi:putative transcription factor